MRVREVINQGVKACDDAGVFSGFARFLMLELLREQQLDMYLMMEEEVPEALLNDYHQKLERICHHEPMGYVLGYEWFYGYKIGVNPSVLIPRQETEELLGQILAYIDEQETVPTIVDVASGSGAIAIALAKELNCHVDASDISEEALKTARENAKVLGADVTFYQGDMLEPFIAMNKHYDLIVCNPPYIKNTEHIQKSVLDYEPHVALFGGEDGLYFYRKILKESKQVLNPQGMIAFEIGFDIGQAVKELAQSVYQHAEVILMQDMNGLDRMVFIKT